MNSIDQTKNVHIEAGKPLKTCAKYKTSSNQRKSPQRAKEWPQWDEYINWPSENDQMELNLKI